eukprot:c7893_g2_i3.p1 GENE.c7893_g2_i3~~c7893_g2_i3.p1  ORF type:complete len:195 (+),score=58.37 c7893_g2_i3:123-707(+)
MVDNEWSSAGLVIFKFSYFVIVVLLLLNLILGIVLDTFAELRQDSIETEDALTNYCFVCSIDRQTFDRFGEGFEAHIKQDHNLWKYVYFLVRTVYSKASTEHTGQESYVSKRLKDQNIDFFPINQAFVLTARAHLEDQEKQKTALQIQETRRYVEQLSQKVEALTTQVASLPETIREILESVVGATPANTDVAA